MTSTDLVPHQSSGVLSLPESEQREILLALGLDMRSPLTKALLLVAERYDLDPLLKQVQIIKGNVYITHKGLLHIAHKSGKLDGIVVEEEGSDKDAYFAKVSVYRKDMSKPFTYTGEFRRSKIRSDGASGREMALKNAERAALGRAFDVNVPTMDDSGDDFDDVMPGNDIELPMDRPALPTPEANALPVPDPTPPAESVMPTPKPVDVDATPTSASTAPSSSAPPASTGATKKTSGANGGGAATNLPADILKVPIPETGEIVHLSKNGHLVNEKTGGEMLAVTDEQKALQERARQIVAEAQARVDAADEGLEKRVPAAKARAAKTVKAVAKKTAKAPAEPQAEPQYTEEQIKRGQHLHMRAKELDIEESLLRDIVYSITDKRTRSTREVGKDEADTVEAIMVAVSKDIVELEYDPEGVLSFEMMTNPLPPDDAEDDVQDAEVVDEPIDWKTEVTSRNIKDATFLRRARALADELGMDMPGSYQDVAKADPKLHAALWEWLEEVSE